MKTEKDTSEKKKREKKEMPPETLLFILIPIIYNDTVGMQ